jgi:hypothetical protein
MSVILAEAGRFQIQVILVYMRICYLQTKKQNKITHILQKKRKGEGEREREREREKERYGQIN